MVTGTSPLEEATQDDKKGAMSRQESETLPLVGVPQEHQATQP